MCLINKIFFLGKWIKLIVYILNNKMIYFNIKYIMNL